MRSLEFARKLEIQTEFEYGLYLRVQDRTVQKSWYRTVPNFSARASPRFPRNLLAHTSPGKMLISILWTLYRHSSSLKAYATSMLPNIF